MSTHRPLESLAQGLLPDEIVELEIAWPLGASLPATFQVMAPALHGKWRIRGQAMDLLQLHRTIDPQASLARMGLAKA